MRAALYSRYSTDLQSASSLADQFRLCEAKATGMVIVARHGDDGVSGSIPITQRPAGRAMMADALARRFEVLIVESLDRISRDQVDLERTVRRLEHLGVRIIGASDGYDSTASGRKVIRAVRGIVAELYLDDLRAKTHRGLSGKIRRGYIASGKSFGYSIVKEEGGSRYRIDEAQARVVRRIFDRYAGGHGVHRIAYDLNAEGVPSPRGGSWAVGAIYGSPPKGSGILSNRLYVGEMVWNRSQWIKDPDTGRRQRMDRPASEWHVMPAPELRIVDDPLWRAVRERINGGRNAAGYKSPGRIPKTLVGGLLPCPHCEGRLIAISALRYGCVTRKDRGPTVCAGFTIERDLVDAAMIATLNDKLLSAEIARTFEADLKELAAQDRGQVADYRRRVAKLDAEIAKLVDAISAVGISDALASRLLASEEERRRLAEQPAPEPQPAINVRAAFAKQKLLLQEALKTTDRDRARRIIAETIKPTRMVLRGKEVWLEIEEGQMFAVAMGGARSTKMVAGARNDLYRLIRLK